MLALDSSQLLLQDSPTLKPGEAMLHPPQLKNYEVKGIDADNLNGNTLELMLQCLCELAGNLPFAVVQLALLS
ncbi:unnamed protein product [Nippostrongylus brasiliensis]|uniref:Protein kinase domain-containing protein n=1 Tax=Nippostrongylus brasiliensis TaxID=27835 RepID=A0A0N4XMD7_NIPBR|nr:unnamed protein product [Nippostrongylus brasiliensis]